jgi:hypothetical protein
VSDAQKYLLKEGIKQLLDCRGDGYGEDNIMLVIENDFPDAKEHEVRTALKELGYYIDDYGLLRKIIKW